MLFENLILQIVFMACVKSIASCRLVVSDIYVKTLFFADPEFIDQSTEALWIVQVNLKVHLFSDDHLLFFNYLKNPQWKQKV